MCYRLAMRHDRTWLYPYMLAKIKEKTDKSNSNAIIALYKKAIEIAPDNWTTKEQEIILDPRYSLVSYLAKNLLTDVIQPADVVKALGTTYIKDHPRHPDDDMEDSKRNMSKEHGFELLCQELGNIKSIDKKRWHHKPFWRQHWILANFFKDVNAAKTELLSLFHFKTTSKTFVNFWRPEFERPGKHFVYIDKYVGALISLLVQTRDLDNLATLIKKTKRADDILLHPTDICAKGMTFSFKK
ncbi:hypothetical protein BC829DRAFT_192245 [Chytridium lagenaria]|nr:hypothetical protein BC829DRAFT_192245 [Chytridium lagenaria]